MKQRLRKVPDKLYSHVVTMSLLAEEGVYLTRLANKPSELHTFDSFRVESLYVTKMFTQDDLQIQIILNALIKFCSYTM